MLPESLLNYVKGLSDADRNELMTHLAGTRPAEPGSPTRPPSIDDLLEMLHDDKVDQMADYLHRAGDPNVSLNLNARLVFFARSAEMVDLLIQAGAEVNEINDFGKSAAHVMASDDRSLPALKRLVQAGADLSSLDCHFETPLDVARREKATANAEWLESLGAQPGPLTAHQRQHPLPRKASRGRPAGQMSRMPSLSQPIQDRSALWQHLRELIQFWDPAIDWQLREPAATATALNSLAGVELPAACLEFHQSGIFDWIAWKAGQSEPSVMRCSWAPPGAIRQRPAGEIVPIMQHAKFGLFCMERDELGHADPAVRYSHFRELSNAARPPGSFHTGCRFSEFAATMVYWELVDATAAQRYIDLESSDLPEASHLRERLTRCALPRLRYGEGKPQFTTIYEGPNTLYVEIESPGRRQSYYGILGGESREALSQLVGDERTDDE